MVWMCVCGGFQSAIQLINSPYKRILSEQTSSIQHGLRESRDRKLFLTTKDEVHLAKCNTGAT